MKLRGLWLFLALMMMSSSAFAGLKVKDGELAGLLSHKKILVEYSYDGLMVGKTEEAAYIEKKVAKKNEAEAGSGDAWLEAWKSDRAGRYQPKFEDLLNKYLGEEGVSVSPDEASPDAVMLVHVTRIEPGHYVGVSSAPSQVDMMVDFVDPADRSKLLCRISLFKVPGQGPTPVMVDTGSRISQAFAKSGKDLAKLLVKKGK